MSATSMQELLKDAIAEGANVMVLKKRGERIPMVLDGMKPRRPLLSEGEQVLSPEQMLNVYVDAVGINGRVTGYQRDLNLKAARKAAAWMREGKPVPPPILALDGKRLYVVDGQHRIAAAIMARLPLKVMVEPYTKQQQADLFHSQIQAQKIDKNVLTLAGNGPFEKYVQDALTNPQHPWHGMVSANRSSKTRISPYAMFQLLVRYVGNMEGQATGVRNIDGRWDKGLADELAPLIACFGNKKTNPLAFRPYALQAIGAAAMWVFRRRDIVHAEDYERWVKHMPQFAWEDFAFLRTQRHYTDALLNHWNKRLTGARRVTR